LKETEMKTDLDQIRELVANAEKLQLDPDAFIPLHTPDVVLVNIAGRRVFGRDTLDGIYREALRSPLAQVITHNELVDVRFVRPDVAIASVVKHVTDQRESGADFPARGHLTYLVTKDPGEGWRIALAHTTPVVWEG
jgi:uncharacterized protein (TIGR02246 family)